MGKNVGMTLRFPIPPEWDLGPQKAVQLEDHLFRIGASMVDGTGYVEFLASDSLEIAIGQVAMYGRLRTFEDWMGAEFVTPKSVPLYVGGERFEVARAEFSDYDFGAHVLDVGPWEFGKNVLHREIKILDELVGEPECISFAVYFKPDTAEVFEAHAHNRQGDIVGERGLQAAPNVIRVSGEDYKITAYAPGDGALHLHAGELDVMPPISEERVRSFRDKLYTTRRTPSDYRRGLARGRRREGRPAGHQDRGPLLLRRGDLRRGEFQTTEDREFGQIGPLLAHDVVLEAPRGLRACS